MGEVYRADDLRLGQPVALKFLPEGVDSDPARLTQLHAEVRMARQVSHPNVCRVYDAGEFEGHTFLSMEYVDGEDLSSLLRRIGRFPQERALELARQICAGLAAAHDRGVVHRDLKPANIMLDGNGRIRITDFGLAGAIGEALRSGTPAYMAPEQLAGQETTPRSDVYSLGLVLYELFTGRRALEARNLAELIAKREQGDITPPTMIVKDLDPAIERAIMRCLASDPAERPSSALAVAAALPGGDPLAAALAAGETPSPELVAASGRTSALGALPAFAALAVAVALLIYSVALSDRILLTSLAPLPKPPLLLEDRIKTILASIGYDGDSADSARGFTSDASYLEYLKGHAQGAEAAIRSGRPPALLFWRRSSPAVMVPTGDESRVSLEDPPLAVDGMTLVVVDPEGRLTRLDVVPPQHDAASGGSAVNWKPLFDAAGLDAAAYAAVPPEWTPLQFADARAAWTGPLPGIPDGKLRIEAAAYRGRPVSFRLIEPWTKPDRAAPAAAMANVSRGTIASTVIILALFLASALIARHNLRRGRGDRRAAFQLAAFVTLVAVGVYLLDGKHVPDPGVEMGRFFGALPLWAAGLLWLFYLALEPYVRRFWPTTVVSWSRLMARQWRDPLVGRDILFGIAIGAVLHTLDVGSSVFVARMDGLRPGVPNLSVLLGTNFVLAVILNQVFNMLLNAFLAVFGMVLLKLFVSREWLAGVLAIGLIVLASWTNVSASGHTALTLAFLIIYIGTVVLTIQRLGLLATVALFLVTYITGDAVVTLDPSRWTFGGSLLVMAIPIALACYGFYAARAGEPLLGRRILE